MVERARSSMPPVATDAAEFPLVDRGDLDRVAVRLEHRAAPFIVSWAWKQFGDGLVLASSFDNCVLIDLARRVAPRIEVVFLDTGFHFPETLAFVEQVRRRYDLNLRVLRPDLGPDDEPCGTGECCQRRKVDPLRRYLTGKEAWLTGLRRVETPERARTPVVESDARNRVVKVNPLAAWTDADLARYERRYDLPLHPHRALGYGSIGCAPTTRPLRPGEDPRAGRWPGSDKVECGLHA